VALAERDAKEADKKDAKVRARIHAARAELATLHGAATKFHEGLVTCAIDELEREIDRVYY
jgi:hypothetical protein